MTRMLISWSSPTMILLLDTRVARKGKDSNCVPSSSQIGLLELDLLKDNAISAGTS